MTLSDHYKAHIESLAQRQDDGDEEAGKSLAIIALLNQGWRFGDDDPENEG